MPPQPHRPTELVNQTQGTVLATEAEVASSLWARAKGLLGRSVLEPGKALILERCRSVHTFGMRFSIDVVFVDRGWKVVAFKADVGPGRVVGPFWSASTAVELPAGMLTKTPLQIGDQLRLPATETTVLSEGLKRGSNP